jgi:hypothetical protein
LSHFIPDIATAIVIVVFLIVVLLRLFAIEDTLRRIEESMLVTEGELTLTSRKGRGQ